MTDHTPDIEWVAIAPGVIEWPTTGFRITYSQGQGSPFSMYHRDQWIGYAGMLSYAKAFCRQRAAELLEMGLEP